MVLEHENDSNNLTTFQEDIHRLFAKDAVHEEPHTGKEESVPLKIYPASLPEMLSPPPMETILKEYGSVPPQRQSEKPDWIEDIDEIVVNNYMDYLD